MNLEKEFTLPLLLWYSQHGRQHLPWKTPVDPYRIWIAEIMLQQTQVKTVIPYFNQFIARFPKLECLAQAEEEEILALWSGLGYYSRARNLLKTAKFLYNNYSKHLPTSLKEWQNLAGIGPSTAAAIVSQAFNLPEAILDGNVKRVLARYFLIKGWPGEAKTEAVLWEKARLCMSKKQPANYTQAIMDLGATCCTLRKPNCPSCPLKKHCQAYLRAEIANYPQKKAKKSLPRKKEHFLVLFNSEQKIYLEKRIAFKLWGGLWSLPSLDWEDCPLQFLEKHYQWRGSNQQFLLKFKHSFSHFHLDIQASAIELLTIKADQLKERPGKWFAQQELSQLGLAKPISKILSYFFASRPNL